MAICLRRPDGSGRAPTRSATTKSSPTLGSSRSRTWRAHAKCCPRTAPIGSRLTDSGTSTGLPIPKNDPRTSSAQTSTPKAGTRFRCPPAGTWSACKRTAPTSTACPSTRTSASSCSTMCAWTTGKAASCANHARIGSPTTTATKWAPTAGPSPCPPNGKADR